MQALTTVFGEAEDAQDRDRDRVSRHRVLSGAGGVPQLHRLPLGCEPPSNLTSNPLTSCCFCSVAFPHLIPARGARISRSAPACLRRYANQHPSCPSTASGGADGFCRGACGPIRSGGAAQAPSRWLVRARWRIARDEFFASDDDFWLFEQLHFVIFLLVHISMGLFVYRVTSVHQLYVFVRLVE